MYTVTLSTMTQELSISLFACVYIYKQVHAEFYRQMHLSVQTSTTDDRVERMLSLLAPL